MPPEIEVPTTNEEDDEEDQSRDDQQPLLGDSVDPDSVDFEPLTTSPNGAATTVPVEESEYQELKTMIPKKNKPDVNWGSSSSTSKDHDSSSPSKSPKKSFFFSWIPGLLHLLPLKIALRLTGGSTVNASTLTSTELSITSSIAICSVFFATIVLTGMVSSGVANLIGITPPPPPTEPLQFSSRSSQLRSYSDNEGLKLISPQGVGLAPPIGTSIPPVMRSTFADVSDLPMELMDTPIYWHIPRSMGTTMKHATATCLGKVVATELGGQNGHNLDERLGTIKETHGIFLNVDTTTPNGLKHAKKLGLAQSKMADVIFTPYVQEAAILFDENHRGRFFTVMREPVERMVSLYYYRRMATWEPNYDETIKDMSIEDFVYNSGENWMVRALTGFMSGQLELAHLNAAKEILRTKFLIGLVEEKTESFRRFEEFFGWRFPSPVAQTCKNNMIYFEWHSRNPHPPLEEDDPLVTKIRDLNKFDAALYEYGRQLFQEQEALFWDAREQELTFDPQNIQSENVITMEGEADKVEMESTEGDVLPP